MVYHEHKHNIINGTSCITQNDTLITCLTPAVSRDVLAGLVAASSGSQHEQSLEANAIEQQQQQPATLNYESGGFKLKMMLIMDDVKSVRNLDEYYHHLPHYITYYEDPQLFRLPNRVIDYVDELTIGGEHLKMKQLDQDMLITIGSHICPLKSVQANQVVCEPPAKIAPVYDDNGRLMDRPLLPIIGLIGSNLRYPIGHMQYNSRQYQLTQVGGEFGANLAASHGGTILDASGSQFMESSSSTGSGFASPSVLTLILLSVIGFVVAFSATFMFALSRFRQSKAEREYKRIQLQMGSLDINGQPSGLTGGGLFDKIHMSANSNSSPIGTTTGPIQQSMRSRAFDYVGGALSGKKLFYQFNQQAQPSFPSSPLTDISSLIGSSPASSGANQHQQHVVKLAPNGAIINATSHQQQQQQQPTYYGLNNNTTSSSSQSSPGSARNSSSGHLFAHQQINHLGGAGNNSFNGLRHQQQQSQQQQCLDNGNKCGNLLSTVQPTIGSSRNFNWTQEAPSTIVPYAVIEACNLTLEGKNAIKEYV